VSSHLISKARLSAAISILVLGCEHTSGPTKPPSSTPTPVSCVSLAGGYDLRVSIEKCQIVPSLGGTGVTQNGCSLAFVLYLDSGLVAGQIHGDTIAFTWSNSGCQPDLTGTGTFVPAGSDKPGRYVISGSVSGSPTGESPLGPCCTRIVFTLVPS